MGTGSKILIGIGVAVVVVGVVVGGWVGGWWVSNAATNKQAQIYQNSYGHQTANEQQTQNLITQWNGIEVQVSSSSVPASEKSALNAQAISLANQICNLAAQINRPTSDVAAWESQNCHN